MKIFLDVMYDDTKNARKIKSCDYNHEGKYPIIDQSSKNVIGYTDEIDGLYNDVPVIIFGDHTRRFKLVEEPFFIGADGTKVLKLRSSVYDYKFIYYYLLHKKIPDTGYNRHFKWVKELEFPEIPRSIQSDIVKKLEVLNDLISSKNKLLESFDILIKSRFVDLFGDIELNDKKWKKIKFGELIKSANNGLARRGNDKAGNIVLRLIELQENLINYSDPNRILLTDDEKKRYKLLEGDLLFARVNGNPKNVGRCATFYEYEEQVYHNDHIIRTSCDKSQLDSVFAAYLFNSEYGKNKISRKIKTSAGQYTINQEGLKSIEIILPPIVIQYSFAEVVKQINKLKSDVQKSIDETQLLMDSLMQEYFG
ncbi:restriction endonuclease subunit S [Veillonella nakazawae]|uniref:Restriction endonuclease subunit S n=1 Tax=Veillonella nakazawae TaxID=2682456 RepID=A0AB35H8P8_9FIRM|nr:restriction endonuclease subunit S [Veillonella nakazawae]MCB8604714.1 restriction endonuclease subunit S [Veillonella nakazawae]